MRFRALLSSVIAIAAAASPSAAAGQSGSPYETDVCPIPAGVRGYTIVVRPEGGTDADSTYLRDIANHTGGMFTQTPRDVRRAAVLAVVRSDGRLRRAELVQASGDSRLDRGALSSVREVFGRRSGMGIPRGMTADSLVVRVLFGEEPAEGETAFRRFSAQHRLPVLRTRSGAGSGVAVPPINGTALVAVSVRADGTVAVSDISPIQATHPDLVPVARHLVRDMRFNPGQSNCEPQSYTLPVQIEFRQGSAPRYRLLTPP